MLELRTDDVADRERALACAAELETRAAAVEAIPAAVDGQPDPKKDD